MQGSQADYEVPRCGHGHRSNAHRPRKEKRLAGSSTADDCIMTGVGPSKVIGYLLLLGLKVKA